MDFKEKTQMDFKQINYKEKTQLDLKEINFKEIYD